jgi:UDP-3-O-[3-hydroxymyristoyl] glucosamine N-acyltransferase
VGSGVAVGTGVSVGSGVSVGAGVLVAAGGSGVGVGSSLPQAARIKAKVRNNKQKVRRDVLCFRIRLPPSLIGDA